MGSIALQLVSNPSSSVVAGVLSCWVCGLSVAILADSGVVSVPLSASCGIPYMHSVLLGRLDV